MMEDNMLKVMIVDDEYLVRNLVRNCIDWNEIGMEIIGEAANAKEALELVDEVVPDIIFTDIYMPSVDGIDFSRMVLEKYPFIKIVVLTGYDEFEFAQRSIKAGIADFLLKPVNDDEIRQTALKLKEGIEKDRKEKKEYSNIRKQFDKNLPYLKEKYLNELLVHNELDTEAVKEQLTYLGISFISDEFQAAVASIVFNEVIAVLSEEQRVLVRRNTFNTIRDYFGGCSNVYIFFDINYRVVILNNDRSIDLKKSAEEIINLVLSQREYSVYIGIGTWKHFMPDIQISYEEAAAAVSSRSEADKSMVIEYSGKDHVQVKKVNKLISNVQNFMLENISDKDLSLAGAAKEFFLNPSYLSRTFKKETGVTFMEYLIKARMERAAVLLRESEMKSYEIAESVGIVDSNYFSTCFKKYTGISVSEYKKMNKK